MTPDNAVIGCQIGFRPYIVRLLQGHGGSPKAEQVGHCHQVTALLFVFTVLFTVPALAQSTVSGVCGRTPQVRDALLVSNFEVELAWALPAFGGRVISILYIGVGPDNVDLRLGWKLLPSSPPGRFDYDLGLEVRRRENGNEDRNPENSIEFRATVTW